MHPGFPTVYLFSIAVIPVLTRRKNRTSSKVYAETLERRIAQLEKLLSRITPNANLTKFLDTDVDEDGEKADEFLPGVSVAVAREIATKTIETYSAEYPPSDPNLLSNLPDETRETLLSQVVGDSFALLFLRPRPTFLYLGASSGGFLASVAFDAKSEALGQDPISRWNTNPHLLNRRRPQFWQKKPWEERCPGMGDIDASSPYDFPDHDLILTLSKYYFEDLNTLLPLLHRPTYFRNISDRLHLRNKKFGALVLVVCAIGSRRSNDPRALADGTTNPLSNGWRWFNQIDLQQKAWLSPVGLYDLQLACLAVFYIHRDTASSLSWTLLGIAVRLAQDLGVHLGYPDKLNNRPTVESEQWKRAWWALVVCDRTISSNMGRPCAVQHEEFDVPLPIECDDEYWETGNPETDFRQPPGKPSTVSAFVQIIKLTNLTALTLRMLYRTQPVPGISRYHYSEVIVSSLDSAMNKWKENLPHFLQWDPTRERNIFFDQTAMIHVFYYHLQILVHRPFIPSPNRPASHLSGPCLSICTNAARLCCNTIKQYEAGQDHCSPFTHFATFVSCVLLLMNIWSAKAKAGSNSTDVAHVWDCIRSLEKDEMKWATLGKLKHVLIDLVGSSGGSGGGTGDDVGEDGDGQEQSHRVHQILAFTDISPYQDVSSKTIAKTRPRGGKASCSAFPPQLSQEQFPPSQWQPEMFAPSQFYDGGGGVGGDYASDVFSYSTPFTPDLSLFSNFTMFGDNGEWIYT